MRREALFDETKKFRYTLLREWSLDPRRALWIMLNPSTADAFQEDPTVRRCISFTKEWGFGGLVVVNLFALRATDPKELRKEIGPVGIENDRHIEGEIAKSDRIITAWGAHGTYMGRDRKVLCMLRRSGRPAFHLGLTGSGHPRHPLYVAGDTKLIQWSF